MTEQTHFKDFVDHIMSDDDSELGKMKAERDYALHCLEREIAICANTQACNDALVKALNDIMQRANESSTGENGLLDTIYEMNRLARNALASVKEQR
jgi:hypothetical protein